jgi:DNA polymerase-1
MFTKGGAPTAIYLKDQGRYILERDDVVGRYTAFEDVEFNIGSPKQRIDKLIELGWEPQEFTEKGNPKPFDKGKLSPSLEKFLVDRPVPEVELIAKWMSINGRANMVNNWLEAWNETDSCIHGTLFVADTLRLRHQKPNTANIPGVRLDRDKHPVRGEQGYFTYEARDLWTARPGRVLVGTDASGLELRMLAHYINRADFTKQVVEGDPHQFNADLVGITRSEAKTLIYAIQYGAQDKKVAKMLGVSISEGGRIRTMFLELLGLKDVMDAAIKEQQNGRVELIDGSKVICPSPHAALNYKLQGGGARVMGLAAILLEQDIRREGLDSLKVADIHDEWQYDVHPDHAPRHAIIAVEAIRRAGQLLQLNVPLDGKSEIGRTWSETH